MRLYERDVHVCVTSLYTPLPISIAGGARVQAPLSSRRDKPSKCDVSPQTPLNTHEPSPHSFSHTQTMDQPLQDQLQAATDEPALPTYQSGPLPDYVSAEDYHEGLKVSAC
jgi:hypothetical protein